MANVAIIMWMLVSSSKYFGLVQDLPPLLRFGNESASRRYSLRLIDISTSTGGTQGDIQLIHHFSPVRILKKLFAQQTRLGWRPERRIGQ
ncbi:hypothetical protein Y695_01170 [Hydrogenophaga sp. T4]|nr:hypothetical protein Y695_01170 [Hydrogenophaga sp. T4]